MGFFVNGVWNADEARRTEDGRYRRQASAFRDRVTADGSSGFKAEPGRYHLYVSHGCPWAHRTVIFRELKGLRDAISLSVVDPVMGEAGWVFSDGPGCTPDPVNGASRLGEIYLAAKPDYTGRVTVPVLWDRKERTIVNNESAEIIRMMNDAFAGLGDGDDMYPEGARTEIDAINRPIYEHVNNGVYKCGFASSQKAYAEAYAALFDTLDEVEARLGRQRYLAGARVTEADWRLFTTLIRFDPVYYGLFKCNRRRIADYPALSNYTRELYQVPGVAGTVDFDHIKRGYWRGMRRLNPSGIVPLGPEIDHCAPHDRAARSQGGA